MYGIYDPEQLRSEFYYLHIGVVDEVKTNNSLLELFSLIPSSSPRPVESGF